MAPGKSRFSILFCVVFISFFISAANQSPQVISRFSFAGKSPHQREYPTIDNEVEDVTQVPFNVKAQTADGLNSIQYECYVQDPNFLCYSPIVFQLYDAFDHRNKLYITKSFVSAVNTWTDRLIIDFGVDNYNPRFHPGGDLILFGSVTNYSPRNVDLYTYSLSQGTRKQITTSNGYDGQANWSPDGTKIVFVSDRSGDYDIFIAGDDGNGQTRLTNSTVADISPTWSPDGRNIAWIRQTSTYTGQIWMMDANGGNAQAVSGYIPFLENLSWSPDGLFLAFDGDLDNNGWFEPYLYKFSTHEITGVNIPKETDTEDVFFTNWGPQPGVILANPRTYLYEQSGWKIYSSWFYLLDLSGNFPYANGDVLILNHTRHSYYLLSNGDFYSNDRASPTIELNIPKYSRAKNYAFYWDIQENGPSGLYDARVSGKDDVTGSWNILLQTQFGKVFSNKGGYGGSGTPGTVKTFRVVVRDYADNTVSTGDLVTSLYLFKSDGSIEDNRGIGLPNKEIDISNIINEVISDFSGHFTAYFATEGNKQITYDLFNIQRELNTDRDLTLVEAPVDDVIQNGNFDNEIAWQGWSLSGNATPVLSNVYSGTQVALLGNPCTNVACIGDLSSTGLQLTDDPFMSSDRQGNLHLVSGNWYTYLDHTTGIWSAPAFIGGEDSYYSYFHSFIWIDSEDNVHAFTSGKSITHSLNPRSTPVPNGNIPISNAYLLAVFADANKTLHLIVNSSNEIYIFSGDQSGQYWMFEQKIPYFNGYSAAADPDGSIWIAGSHENTCLIHHLVNGENIFVQCPFTPITDMKVIVDPGKRIHLFDTNNYYVYSPETGWTGPIPMPWNVSHSAIAMSPDGSIWATHFVDNRLEFGYLPAGKDYFIFDKYPGSFEGVYDPCIYIDQESKMHMVISQLPDLILHYAGPYRSQTAFSSSIQQAINIPEDFHKPTLSFNYQFVGSSTSPDNFLEVQILSEGGTNKVEYQYGQVQDDWRHAWVDLSAYSGKSITLRFMTHQDQDAPVFNVRLDDVSIGSWVTPVVHSVQPAKVLVSGLNETEFIIQGQNFMGDLDNPPLVQIGENNVRVTFVSDTEIHFLFENVIASGIYNLTVSNPSGNAAFLPSSFEIQSNTVFLPSVIR
jgi:hypothetical protein